MRGQTNAGTDGITVGGCDGLPGCQTQELPVYDTIFPFASLAGLLGPGNAPQDPGNINIWNGGCTTCHVPNYVRPRSCDVDACTPDQKAQWCANAKSMAALGLQVTGQSGLGPLLTGGILAGAAYYFESLGGPLTLVGAPQANAAYMANYVDSVCNGG